MLASDCWHIGREYNKHMNEEQILSILRSVVAEAHDLLPPDKRESLLVLHRVIESKIISIANTKLLAEMIQDGKNGKNNND